jgi:L-aminopeptidase/D-esterase-like protein
MIYDRAMQNRYVNPKEAFAMLVGDTKQFRQLTEGVNPEENLAAMQAVGGGGESNAGAGAGATQNPLVGGAGTSLGGLNV